MNNHAGQSDVSPGYVSYLLRLWRTQSGGNLVWRASLQEPLTQEVTRFDTLPGLFDFLLAQVGLPDQGATVDGDTPPTGSS
jgi:hypothetical protein